MSNTQSKTRRLNNGTHLATQTKTTEIPILIILSLLTACTTKTETTETGTTDPFVASSIYCNEVNSPIDLDDSKSIGVSANEFLTAIKSPQPHTVLFADDTSDTLNWSITVDQDSISLVTTEAVYQPSSDGTMISIGIICDDYISMDATISIVSDDGRLNESHQVSLSLVGFGQMGNEPHARFSVTLPITGLAGTLDVDGLFDASAYDNADLSISGEIYFTEGTAADFNGELNAFGEITGTSDGVITADVASSTRVTLANWAWAIDSF